MGVRGFAARLRGVRGFALNYFNILILQYIEIFAEHRNSPQVLPGCARLDANDRILPRKRPKCARFDYRIPDLEVAEPSCTPFAYGLDY